MRAVARAHPSAPARIRAALGDSGAAPGLGTFLRTGRDRLGWEVGLRLGLTLQGSQLGRTGLRGARDRPC